MASNFGKNISVQIFGESHGTAIGVVIDGIKAGEFIDENELMHFMSRRAPGSKLATSRKESDTVQFISGVKEGIICGSPICAVIQNKDQHSSDYNQITNTPRPSHADYTAYIKYNKHADMRGGGHFSGRLTAPLCIAGGIAKQILSRQGIKIWAHILQIGPVKDKPFDTINPLKDNLNELSFKPLAVIDDNCGEGMRQQINKAKENKDSIGGEIECCITGIKPGLGQPMFDGIEGRLAYTLFGIPAVKGVEFGSGFLAPTLYGSQNNDEFVYEGNKIVTKTNNHGGILGGITTGMPIIFRTAIKPTPSIAKKQNTVNLSTHHNAEIEIKGRHDPCIAVRAVPVIEAAAAITMLDIIYDYDNERK